MMNAAEVYQLEVAVEVQSVNVSEIGLENASRWRDPMIESGMFIVDERQSLAGHLGCTRSLGP